jgi:hypothetical protein
MRTAVRWGVAAVALTSMLALGSCGLEQEKKRKDPFDDDHAAFSASILQDIPDDDEFFGNTLSPAERDALANSHAAKVPEHESSNLDTLDTPGGEQSNLDRKLDKAGKMGLSFLTVGLSLAAAAAPFFLF